MIAEVALALLVAAAATTIDYAGVRHQKAVADLEAHRASRWSVIMFVAASIGLVAAVQDGWWLLVPEGAGYYAGTYLAVRELRLRKARTTQGCVSFHTRTHSFTNDGKP